MNSNINKLQFSEADIAKSHEIDDHTRLRDIQLRYADGEADYLEDGAHALRNGVPDIAQEFAERALSNSKKTQAVISGTAPSQSPLVEGLRGELDNWHTSHQAVLQSALDGLSRGDHESAHNLISAAAAGVRTNHDTMRKLYY